MPSARSLRRQVAGRRAVTARNARGRTSGCRVMGRRVGHRSSRRRAAGDWDTGRGGGQVPGHRAAASPGRPSVAMAEGGRCVSPTPSRSSAGVRVAGTSHRNVMRTRGRRPRGAASRHRGARPASSPGRRAPRRQPNGTRGTGSSASPSSTRDLLGTPAAGTLRRRPRSRAAASAHRSPRRRVTRPPRRAVASSGGTGTGTSGPRGHQAVSSPGRRAPRGRPARVPGRSVRVAESEQLGGVAVGLWKGAYRSGGR